MSSGNGRDESARVASLSAHLTSARLVPTASLSSEQRSARVDELVTQGNALAAQVNFLTGALKETRARTDAVVSVTDSQLKRESEYNALTGDLGQRVGNIEIVDTFRSSSFLARLRWLFRGV